MPDEYYSKSSLLFWAIISIAARRYERDVSLLRKLSNCVTRLAWEVISTQGNRITTVQAMLLLCTWPLPTSSLLLENTSIWCDIAFSMATQLGLYQPDEAGFWIFLSIKLHLHCIIWNGKDPHLACQHYSFSQVSYTITAVILLKSTNTSQ